MCKYSVVASRFKTDYRKESCVRSSTMLEHVRANHRSENVFEMCKGRRMRKRVHNDWSTEDAGRGGASCVHENRFAGSYIHVVSRSRIK